jgi:hypothetical protein
MIAGHEKGVTNLSRKPDRDHLGDIVSDERVILTL